MSRETALFPEYLGNISSEALLQNLTEVNPNCNTVDDLRLNRRGFTVTAEYDKNRKFVRIVLEVAG